LNPLKPFYLALAFLSLLLTTPLSRADVWAYVDEKGVAHFAAAQLDSRYQLFARIEDSVAGSSNTSGTESAGRLGEAANQTSSPKRGRAVAPGTNRRLLGLFEVSPDFFAVRHHLRQASQRHGVGYELLQALIATESGFNRNAISPKGAVGLMQLMPATASRFGVKPTPSQSIEKRLLDPGINIDAGTRYLRHLIDMFPGQLELALAAYNAGEGAVVRAGSKVPNYPETQQYVKTVSQLYLLLQPVNSVGTPNGLVAKAQPDPAHVLRATGKPSMMVPGVVAGRGNMVQGLGNRSGQVTLLTPSESSSPSSTN
jgi:soluble lytic murein transglycosylase-like protein